MSEPIDFEARKREIDAKGGLRAATQAPALDKLRQCIDGAHQAYRSALLIQSGYCGSGLKQEMEQASRLSELLAEAGSLVQGMIIADGTIKLTETDGN